MPRVVGVGVMTRPTRKRNSDENKGCRFWYSVGMGEERGDSLGVVGRKCCFGDASGGK